MGDSGPVAALVTMRDSLVSAPSIQIGFGNEGAGKRRDATRAAPALLVLMQPWPLDLPSNRATATPVGTMISGLTYVTAPVRRAHAPRFRDTNGWLKGMTPRRTILRELTRRRREGDEGYTRPGTIAGFDTRPARYQAAVNELLQERLINGRKDQEGRLAITLNEQRLADVKKELRPLYARPVVWLALLVVIFAAAAVLTR
jgi:hypothetical protein